MKRGTRSFVALAICAAAILSLTAAALGRVSSNHSVKVTIPAFNTKALTATPGLNWMSPAGNLQGQRHSSLTQVAPSNVGALKLAWHTKLAAPNVGDPVPLLGGEASQVVYNGTMFAEDQYGRVYALDATTGNQLWYYEPNNPQVPQNTTSTSVGKIASVAATRGVSIGDGMVFAEEPQGNMVALDATTGRQIWAHTVGSVDRGIGLSQAPLYYNGKVIAATSGGDSGYPCIVFALDAKTGKPLWHFSLIPYSKNQVGYETWAHPLPFDGGAAVWSTQTVDPVAGIVYASTGNPLPYNGLLRGPGKEYYTVGEIALDVNTGKLKWFFQAVHHDNWDADQSQQAVAYDMNYGGTVRKAIVFSNKDGLVYILDRITGQPIIPVTEMPVQQSKEASTWPTQPIPATDPLVPQSVPNPAAWAGLTAPDGKPYNIGPGGPAGSFTAIDSTAYSVTAAFGRGASSQRPASVDPKTGLMINESSPGFNAFEALPASEVGMKYHDYNTFNALKSANLAATPAGALSGSRLSATDLKTGKLVWTVDHLSSAQQTATPGAPTPPSNAFSGGNLTTDSGLIFTFSSAMLQAYNESNGQLLWSSAQLAGASKSNPMTYMVAGKQYVTAQIGGTGDLYAYSLG